MSETQQYVYVVDDDLMVLDLISSRLAKEGYNVSTYSDPSAFLEAAPNLPAGCIVLDLAMPGNNGLQVQEALAEMGVRLPIIFYTGQGSVRDAVKGMQAGAADFLQKGPHFDPLVRAVETEFRNTDVAGSCAN